MSLHTLMFGWEYPPHHTGGLGVACQGLVRGLLKNGTQVTLVLPSSKAEAEDGLLVRSPTEELCKTITVEADFLPYDSFASYEERVQRFHIPQDQNEPYGKDLGEAVARFTALSVSMTKDLHPDVVHCHDWMTYEAGARAAHHHDAPLIAHIHATELDRTDFHPNEWIANRERSGLLKADRVIAVSRYTKGMLEKHYGIPGDKITVVHNGHEQPRIESKRIIFAGGHKRRPLVLFLGRLTVQKNPWQFLDVCKRVHDLRPDVQFVMAGDGPMLQTLVDRACELGLADSIIFTGKVNKREVQSLYASADCFVMPSLSEPFGLVALEAIAHGTPVILSKQSGVAEVVDHAFKVDYWDIGKMSDCILTVLREHPLAAQLSTEAPRILQKLTWKNQAQHVTSIYKQLLS